MNYRFLVLILLTTSFSSFAQKSQVQLAQNTVAKLQVSIANKEDVKKQMTIIGEGIKALDLAQQDKKTKNWPETWANKAYLSSYIALIDNGENAEKHFNLAVDAEAKAKTLDKFQANTDLIKAASYNIIIKKLKDGNAAYQQNDFINAFNLLKQVSNFLPKDTAIAINAAISAQNIQAYDEALVYFKRAIENKARNPYLYQSLASIYNSKFESEQAIKTLEEGLKLNPYHQLLTTDYINLLLDNEKFDSALKVIEGNIATERRNKLLLYLFGYLQQTTKQNYAVAETAYKKVLDIDQNYFDALYQLGLVYLNNANDNLKTKNTQKFTAYVNRAEFVLLRAHEINQNDRNTIQLLIEIYTRKNRLDRVQELKRKLNEF